jgi:hypothetical protein
MQEKAARKSLKFNEEKYHDFFKSSLFEDFRDFGDTK